jgi:hypothetical protein
MATIGAIVPGRYVPWYAAAVDGTPWQVGDGGAGDWVAGTTEVAAPELAAAVAVALGCPLAAGVPLPPADAGLPGLGAPHAASSAHITAAAVATDARFIAFTPPRRRDKRPGCHQDSLAPFGFPGTMAVESGNGSDLLFD